MFNDRDDFGPGILDVIMWALFWVAGFAFSILMFHLVISFLSK